MIVDFKSIINCETLGGVENFQSTCFEHVFFEAFQYGVVEKKCAKA
jgi:hypothetical protein